MVNEGEDLLNFSGFAKMLTKVVETIPEESLVFTKAMYGSREGDRV